jgi:TetR/AcrR family fatty acid metabolism transcriptional regulator
LAHEDKRRLLLDAAVRVFAHKGYHDCRVGDIAKEAGVAYGLLRETWGQMLAAIGEVEQSGDPARVQVRKVVAIVLRSWQLDPDLIRVLVREITRSPHIGREVEEIEHAFAALERIVRGGQEEGEFRSDLDARLASQVLYGALEQILTVWVFEQPPESDKEVTTAERTVTALFCDGLALEPASAPA